MDDEFEYSSATAVSDQDDGFEYSAAPSADDGFDYSADSTRGLETASTTKPAAAGPDIGSEPLLTQEQRDAGPVKIDFASIQGPTISGIQAEQAAATKARAEERSSVLNRYWQAESFGANDTAAKIRAQEFTPDEQRMFSQIENNIGFVEQLPAFMVLGKAQPLEALGNGTFGNAIRAGLHMAEVGAASKIGEGPRAMAEEAVKNLVMGAGIGAVAMKPLLSLTAMTGVNMLQGMSAAEAAANAAFVLGLGAMTAGGPRLDPKAMSPVKEVPNALQERGPAPEVPRAGEAGKDVAANAEPLGTGNAPGPVAGTVEAGVQGEARPPADGGVAELKQRYLHEQQQLAEPFMGKGPQSQSLADTRIKAAEDVIKKSDSDFLDYVGEEWVAKQNAAPTPKPLERAMDLVSGAVGGWNQKAVTPALRKGSGPAAVNPAVQKLNAMFDRRDAEVARKLRTTWGQVRDVLGSQIVAYDAPIRRRLEADAAQNVIMMKDLSRGASWEADRRFKDSRDEVFKTIPYEWEREFGRYLDMRRTLEVSKVKGPAFKNPGGFGATEAQQWLDHFNASADPRLKVSFEQAAEKYYETFRSNIRALEDEGILSQEDAEDIISKHQNYSPREFIEYMDPGAGGGTKAGLVQTTDSGIKALTHGSESMLYSNPRYFMEQTILRTEKRIANNRAARALYDFVYATPNNQLGAKPFNERATEFIPELDPVTGKTVIDPATKKPLGNFVSTSRIADPPTGYESITSFVDGKPQAVIVPVELARYWKSSDPALNRTAAEIISWLSGSKIVKAMATGYNPEFVLSNMPRDMAYNWFRTAEYNPVLPIGLGQIVVDYGRTARDAFAKRGRYVDYVRQGGGMEYLSTSGMLTARPWEMDTPSTRAGRNIFRVLNKINETSEVWTRLAVRERAIRNGRSPQQATWIARNALDFAQGGTAIKMADSAMPYLNAMIQGTRGTFAAFKSAPAVTTFKAAQLVGLGMLMYYAHRGDEYDTVSNQEKAQKWIFRFLPPEKRGKAIFNRYVAVAKDQGQQVFTAMGEAIASYLDTGKANLDPLKYAVNNNMPGISVLPPVLSAWIAYFRNFDTYRMQQVWRGRELASASLEQSEKTSAGAVAMTDFLAKAGIEVSPERAAVAFTKIVPNNPISWMAGQIAGMQLPQDQSVGKEIERLDDWPFIRRFIRATPRVNPTLQDQLEAGRLGINTAGKSRPEILKETTEAQRKLNDQRQTTDNLIMRSGTNRISTVAQLMGEPSPQEQKRLTQRLMDSFKRE